MKKNVLTLSVLFSILIFSSFILVPKTETADTYTVIKVDGQITYVKSGSDMSRGDKFLSSDKLDFKDQASRAAVISKLKGRFVLTPKKKSTSKANLLPAMSNISMRKGEILNLIDLQNYFSENLTLLDKIEVAIKTTDYPIDNDNFFYLTYQHNGEQIAKKLTSENGSVFIYRDSIFMIDGQPIPRPGKIETTLYHRNATAKTSLKINSFNLVSPIYSDLLAELEIIKADQKTELSFPEMSKTFHAYLTEFYGKTDKEELGLWLKNHPIK